MQGMAPAWERGVSVEGRKNRCALGADLRIVSRNRQAGDGGGLGDALCGLR